MALRPLMGVVMGSLMVLTSSKLATAQPSASFPEPEAAPRAAEPPPAAVSPAPLPPPVAPAPAAPVPVAPAPLPAAPAPVAPPPPRPWQPSSPWEPATTEALPTGFRPPVLPAYPGMEPPPGYRHESHANTGLAVGGGVTLGAGYAVAVGYALSQDMADGTGWLAAPIIGPWIAIGKRDFDCNVEGRDPLAEAEACQNVTRRETRVVSLLAALGVAEGLGATLLVIGLFDRQHEWVRTDIGDVSVRFDAAPLPEGAVGVVSGTF